MRKFILQVTPDGGKAGTRIVSADVVHSDGAGGLGFYKDGLLVAAFASYVACMDEETCVQIDAETAAWAAANED